MLRMHRAEVSKIDASLVPEELLSAAAGRWDEAVELGEQYGVRNSQACVLAPTGTIGLMMDCDTTGIEPDLALAKAKKLVGGGTMIIVNQTVPRALKILGYRKSQVDDIIAYIDEEKTILGAPHLGPTHRRLRLLHGRQLHPLHGPRQDDGRRPAVHLRRHQQVRGGRDAAVDRRRPGPHRQPAPGRSARHVPGRGHRGGLPGRVRKTDAFYYGGTRPVREVVLASGQRVTGTPNHRLLVATRTASTGGASTRSPRASTSPSATAPTCGPTRPPPRGQSAPAPQVMTDDFAFLLGASPPAGEIDRARHRHVRHPCRAAARAPGQVWQSLRCRGPGHHPPRRPARRLPSPRRRPWRCPRRPRRRGAAEPHPGGGPAVDPGLVLAYLEGLFLAAQVNRAGGAATVSLDHAPSGLLDDLQAVLTNLGVLHRRADPTRRAPGRRRPLPPRPRPLGRPHAAGVAAEELRSPRRRPTRRRPRPRPDAPGALPADPAGLPGRFAFLRDDKVRT